MTAAAAANQRGETAGKALGAWRRSSTALSKAEGRRVSGFGDAGVFRGDLGGVDLFGEGGFVLDMILFHFMVTRGTQGGLLRWERLWQFGYHGGNCRDWRGAYKNARDGSHL